MKKISKKISMILVYIISCLSINNVYALVEKESTKSEKIGLTIYLVVSVLILASLCTYFHLRITRVKYLEDKEKKIVERFNKKVRIIRWIFIAIVYFTFVTNLFLIMITIMYCIEGLGKSLTDIVIYSPMSLATQHFIETMLLSGLVLILAKLEHVIVTYKIKQSKDYNNEEKEVLFKYYK